MLRQFITILGTLDKKFSAANSGDDITEPSPTKSMMDEEELKNSNKNSQSEIERQAFVEGNELVNRPLLIEYDYNKDTNNITIDDSNILGDDE